MRLEYLPVLAKAVVRAIRTIDEALSLASLAKRGNSGACEFHRLLLWVTMKNIIDITTQMSYCRGSRLLRLPRRSKSLRRFQRTGR